MIARMMVMTTFTAMIVIMMETSKVRSESNVPLRD